MVMKSKVVSFAFVLQASILFFVPFFAYSAENGPRLARSLKYGDVGEDVRSLQVFLNQNPSTSVALQGLGSKGNETVYFGSATKAAVIRFQEKYIFDILTPAGLRRGTGFVGPLTFAKIAGLSAVAKASNQSEINSSSLNSHISLKTPQVFSVSPDRVRSGNYVTVRGEGFSPTGNTVILQYASIEARFDNLPSPDGKTITFTFKPPAVRTMTKEEIAALPTDVFNRLVSPVQAVGGTIDDLVTPYKGIQNEAALVEFLKQNSHSFDELYDYFYVTVENSNGKGTSDTALLWGLRKLPFGADVAENNRFFSNMGKVFEYFIPKAHAQAGGGFHTGMIMYCTCGGGFLTFQTDITGGGGLLYFAPGFIPVAGTGYVASPWIGYYTQGGGICSIYAGLFCISISAGMPLNPWGAAL